jgi:hypothetical protein
MAHIREVGHVPRDFIDSEAVRVSSLDLTPRPDVPANLSLTDQVGRKLSTDLFRVLRDRVYPGRRPAYSGTYPLSATAQQSPASRACSFRRSLGVNEDAGWQPDVKIDQICSF